MTSAFSWQNSLSLCPASFRIPRPNLPVTPGVSWLPTFAFQSSVMKRTSFLGVSFKRSCKSSSDQIISVAQSCPTLRPHELQHARPPCSSLTPRVHSDSRPSRVSDAIQPSHPLSSPSPPAPNPSQHQGLFKWVSSLHQVAKVLESQLQHESFQWIFRIDFL